MSPQPTNPRKCGTCGLEPRFCDCPEPVPAERRRGERERRTMVTPTDLLRQWKENERRGPADRRSPGGAGLDCAVVEKGGGSAAGERLAAIERAADGFGYGAGGVPAEEVCVMGLCETEHVVLQPRAYRFIVMPGCAKCEQMARDATDMPEATATPWATTATTTPAHHSTNSQSEPSSSPSRAPGDEPAEPLGWVVVEHRGNGDRRVTQQYGDDSRGPAPHLMDHETAQAWCDDCNEAAWEQGRDGHMHYTIEPVGGAEREDR